MEQQKKEATPKVPVKAKSEAWFYLAVSVFLGLAFFGVALSSWMDMFEMGGAKFRTFGHRYYGDRAVFPGCGADSCGGAVSSEDGSLSGSCGGGCTADTAKTCPMHNLQAKKSPEAVVPITGGNTDSGSKACEDLKQQVANLMDSANQCEQGSDCIIAESLGCPFGCYSFVNKSSDITPAIDTVIEYRKACPACEYSCTTPPSADEIKCFNNKCIDTRELK